LIPAYWRSQEQNVISDFRPCELFYRSTQQENDDEDIPRIRRSIWPFRISRIRRMRLAFESLGLGGYANEDGQHNQI
jgi:hypothetical protein